MRYKTRNSTTSKTKSNGMKQFALEVFDTQTNLTVAECWTLDNATLVCDSLNCDEIKTTSNECAGNVWIDPEGEDAESSPFSWFVEFRVHPLWVADGFNLTAERALEMLRSDLNYSTTGETYARIISKPTESQIKSQQGFAV